MPATCKTLEESVDELLQSAPEVFAALKPQGVKAQEYFSRLLTQLNMYGLYFDISTIADSVSNAKDYMK